MAAVPECVCNVYKWWCAFFSLSRRIVITLVCMSCHQSAFLSHFSFALCFYSVYHVGRAEAINKIFHTISFSVCDSSFRRMCFCEEKREKFNFVHCAVWNQKSKHHSKWCVFISSCNNQIVNQLYFKVNVGSVLLSVIATDR